MKKDNHHYLYIIVPAVLIVIAVIAVAGSIRRTNKLLSRKDVLSCEVYIDHYGNQGLHDDRILQDDQVLRLTEKSIAEAIKNHLIKASSFRPIVKDLESYEKRPDFYATDIILKNDLACYKIQFVDMQSQRQIDYLYRDQPVFRITMLQKADNGAFAEKWDYLFTIPSYEFFRLAVLAFEYDSGEIMDIDEVKLYEGG